MISFFRGPKKAYSLNIHGKGIYFATDTKEIIVNGYEYTGPEEEKTESGWVDVVGSVEEAFTSGGMATLTENKEVPDSLVVKSGVSAILDLNGYNIMGTSTAANSLLIKVEKGASLVIRGEGTLNGGSDRNVVALAVYGDCRVESGNFTVGPDATGLGNACVEVNGGTLHIAGGTFSCATPYNGKYYVLNKKDGSDSVISVTGGTFINYDPSNSATENPIQDFVANGYQSVKIEGTNNYQVVKIK